MLVQEDPGAAPADTVQRFGCWKTERKEPTSANRSYRHRLAIHAARPVFDALQSCPAGFVGKLSVAEAMARRNVRTDARCGDCHSQGRHHRASPWVGPHRLRSSPHSMNACNGSKADG